MKKIIFLLLIQAAFISVNANAGLIGDSIKIERKYNQFKLSQTSPTVTSGFELYSFDSWAFNIHDYAIDMYSLSNIGYTGYWEDTFNGFVFSDLDFGKKNEVISNISATGIDSHRISFTNNSFQLNLAGLGFSNSKQINLKIDTKIISAPEPESWGTFLAALLSLMYIRKARRLG